jgi:putative peptidoglycan lipid II flippase
MNKSFRIFSRLFLIVLLIKTFDVFKNLVIASVLGVSSSADIYSAIIMIPDSLIVLLGLDTIRGVVNSEYAHSFTQGEKQKMWDSFNNLFNILFWISIVVVSLIILFNNILIDVLLPGFEGAKRERAIEISYIIFPVLFLKVFTGYFHSVYSAVKRFYFPVIAPVVIGILLLISILLPYYKNEAIFNLSFATLAGNMILFGLLISGLFKLNAYFKFKKPEIDEITRKVIRGSFSILLLVICNQLFLFSKNFFASFYGEGAISSLHYSGMITNVVVSMIFATFFTVLISDLSSLFSTEKRIIAKNLFLNTLTGLIYIIVPIIVFFIIYRERILALVYLRGNFTLEGIEMTIKPFLWDAMSLFTFILYIIPTTLYLAKKKYKLMTKIGSIVYLSGIVFNFIFTNIFGYWGIAVSVFITTGIYGSLLLYFSRSFIGKIAYFVKQVLTILACGIISFVILYILKLVFFDLFTSYNFLEMIIILSLNSLLAFLIFVSLSMLFKINYLGKIKAIYSRSGSG